MLWVSCNTVERVHDQEEGSSNPFLLWGAVFNAMVANGQKVVQGGNGCYGLRPNH